MTTAAQARRSTWLRRIRAITAWVSAAATIATLLVAAVVGSASPPRRVPVARHTATRRQPAVVLHVLRSVPARRRHHRIATTGEHAPAPRRPVVAATAPAPAPPAPAPPVEPVVVSGGS